MRRVSIAEIMTHTGLSRATVDRVLNRRGRVHHRTRELVEDTLKRLRAGSPDVPQLQPKADLVLRVGRGMMEQMRAAWDRAGASGTFHDMYQAKEAELVATIRSLGANTANALIITAKNTDRIADALREARRRGKRVIAILSDLAQDARDCFVGIDNRAAGRTAAFLVGRTLGDRPARVGVVLGDLAFRCHEDREIGFRTGLRANFPKVVIAGEALGEDNPALTRDAIARLLRDQPEIEAIYNVGGGNAGLVEALRRGGRRRGILLVGHEVNKVTIPLMTDGWMDYAIAADVDLILHEALRIAAGEGADGRRESTLLDFSVYTRFNLPVAAAADPGDAFPALASRGNAHG
ncbi:MAG: LacI family DNA-binding transcriptional regulator [Rhodospirillaceae bacterium]|nr:LacI family DNA-binding transcriptional regulator [Rhodospirillaceae bacterium]